MKNILWSGAVLLALATSTVRPAQACDECSLRKQGTYLGQFTILGNGTVRTWVKYDAGKPTSLGVTFSETALQGLPKFEDLPKEMPMMEYELALPKEAKATGFDHISLDYVPRGHEPLGIYDKPHFDVHFYMTPSAERKKITAKGKDLAICEKKPAAGVLPAGYIFAPGTALPQMGMHSVDPTGPEFRGEGFKQTFIYGYYNGKMTFVEPMIAISHLETKPNISEAIKTPAVYEKPGFYPTRYSVAFDETRREYTISLDGLTWRVPPASKSIAKAAAKPVTKPAAKPIAKPR